MSYEYSPEEIRLAREIAEALDDMHSISYHLKNARRYKEEFLRKQLQIVMSKPDNKIRISRARLYTHLMNQHEIFGNGGH